MYWKKGQHWLPKFSFSYLYWRKLNGKISVLLPASSGWPLRLVKGTRGAKAVLLCLIWSHERTWKIQASSTGCIKSGKIYTCKQMVQMQTAHSHQLALQNPHWRGLEERSTMYYTMLTDKSCWFCRFSWLPVMQDKTEDTDYCSTFSKQYHFCGYNFKHISFLICKIQIWLYHKWRFTKSLVITYVFSINAQQWERTWIEDLETCCFKVKRQILSFSFFCQFALHLCSQVIPFLLPFSLIRQIL